MILIPEISRPVRFDVLISQYPLIFLIEINGCVLLQGNSENFLTENVIQDAFSLTLSCRSSYPMPPVQAPQEVLHNLCLQGIE